MKKKDLKDACDLLHNENNELMSDLQRANERNASYRRELHSRGRGLQDAHKALGLAHAKIAVLLKTMNDRAEEA